MKSLISFLFLQLTMLFAAAQQTTIDSLKSRLQTAKPDTGKVLLLAALSYQYAYAKPDSAILFAQQGYDLSLQLNFLKGESLCLNRMGSANVNFGNAPKALELLQKARAISEQINDQTGVARSINNIATIYGEQGEHAKALPYLLQVKDIQEIRDNPALFPIFLENIGECYFHLNQLDSASLYIQQAYNLSRQSQNDAAIGDIQRIFGDIEAKKNNRALALQHYRESIISSVKSGDMQHTGGTYLSIANLYRQAGQTDSATFYAQKALQTAQAGSFTKDVLDASQLLAAIYENKQQYADAFRYYKIATAAKDSLFSQEKVKQMLTLDFDEKMRRYEVETANNRLRDQIRIYSLLAGLSVLLLIALLLVRNNRQKQRAYTLLQKQKQVIDTQKAKAEQTLQELKTAQAQLIQSEKMASLGQLTAGIAHEIQNPLNFVNNFSEINTELIEELETEADKGNLMEVKAIAKGIKENEERIVHHGKRADSIVKGMLQHSRASSGKKELADIHALIEESLRLSYYGLRTKDKAFNATITTHYDEHIGKINIITQEISRVLLNLFNNAFYAICERKKILNGSFEPLLSVSTEKRNDYIFLRVCDNGTGIPQGITDKIFQPFFTTKPTGQGTGLGLSLSYDIIKAHGGEIKVESKEGEGTVFIIQLPV